MPADEHEYRQQLDELRDAAIRAMGHTHEVIDSLEEHTPATTCSPNHTGRSRRRPCDCCRACWRNCTRTSPNTQIRANWCAICVTFDTDAIHVSASDTIASDDTRLGLGSGLDRYRTIIETRGGTFQTRAGQAHWQLDVSIPIDGDR